MHHDSAAKGGLNYAGNAKNRPAIEKLARDQGQWLQDMTQEPQEPYRTFSHNQVVTVYRCRSHDARKTRADKLL